MKTGEGNAGGHAAGLLNALAGRLCTIVTVHDYLAVATSEWMSPLLQSARFERWVIVHDLTTTQRRQLPGHYVREQQRIRALLSPRHMKYDLAHCVQRHHFANLDEVDSILIDEARTPLIISGPSEDRRTVREN